MMDEQKTGSDSGGLGFDGLDEAIRYLQFQNSRPGSISQLRQELSTLVALAVPKFADEICIDCFQPNGATQRFSMLANDDSVIAAYHAESGIEKLSQRSLKVSMHDGMSFLGSLHVLRLPSASPFIADERLDTRLLAKVVSTRIATCLSNVTRTDCELPAQEIQPADKCQAARDSSDSRLHRAHGVLAHELRNPLSVFSTAVDLMENESRVPERLQKILIDFFAQSQSADSLDHSTGGLGIGLGLVEGLVELHDGTVMGHSDGKGTGSTFHVRLPVCEPVEKSDAADLPSLQSECKCVLIVDDRRENEFVLKALVNKIGTHETRSATDGPSAMEVLRDFQPDLILLDLGLPGMSGLELAKVIRNIEHCRDTFIVALTGHDELAIREQAQEAGIDLYRLKPASMDMLKDVFRQMNARQELAKEVW